MNVIAETITTFSLCIYNIFINIVTNINKHHTTANNYVVATYLYVNLNISLSASY